MIVYILHDPRLPDDAWQRCAGELERQGIKDYQLHFPVRGPGDWTVAQAINASHKNLVALAKYHRLPEVCIMESDVWFPAVDGWNQFLEKKPALYDLYLAATYGPFYVSYSDGLRMLQRPCGFHCYCISATYYDQFLTTPDTLHIDDAQHSGFYLVTMPFIALQWPGYSYNAKKDVDYNHDLFKYHQNYIYGYESIDFSTYPVV